MVSGAGTTSTKLGQILPRQPIAAHNYAVYFLAFKMNPIGVNFTISSHRRAVKYMCVLQIGLSALIIELGFRKQINAEFGRYLSRQKTGFPDAIARSN